VTESLLSRSARYSALLAVLALFFVFLLWPVWRVVSVGLGLSIPGVQLESVAAYLAAVFRDEEFRSGVINSTLIAALVTIACAAISVPLALLSRRFEFRGKSGIAHCVRVSDPALARIVRRCADIPGQELFQWIDSEGKRHRIDSADVNAYLRDASGGPFTAKDFRTWFATIEALQALRRKPAPGPSGPSNRENTRQITAAPSIWEWRYFAAPRRWPNGIWDDNHRLSQAAPITISRIKTLLLV